MCACNVLGTFAKPGNVCVNARASLNYSLSGSIRFRGRSGFRPAATLPTSSIIFWDKVLITLKRLALRERP